MSFGDAEYAGKRKKTRREIFLEEMEQVEGMEVVEEIEEVEGTDVLEEQMDVMDGMGVGEGGGI